MLMTARVTVATRTKNRPLLLRRALDSVLSQTFADFELVVVNDAGDAEALDALLEPFLERAAGRLRVVTNVVSNGREAAMNDGFRDSDADYLVLHDDDDSWAPDFLQKTVDYLDAHAEDAGVATRTEVVFERVEGDTVIEESREVLADDAHAVTLIGTMRRSTVPPISFLFRRSAYLEVGEFDGSLPVLADWDFLLRLLTRHTVGFISGEPLAFWHQRLASLGPDGNSVVIAADEHSDYGTIIRDRYLRKALDGGGGIGPSLLVTSLFEDMERSSAESRRQASEFSQVSQLKQAEALEVTKVALLLEIAKLEQQQRDVLQSLDVLHTVAEVALPVVNGARRAARPVAKTVRAGKKVASGIGSLVRAGARVALKSRRGAGAGDGAAVHEAGVVSIRPEIVNTPMPLVAAGRPREDARLQGKTPRRVAFYLFFDPEGQVDDYVLHKLTALREHVEHIFVVSNSPISDEGKARLATVADTVLERENKGFDVWGYKEAQEHFGWDRLAEYDELILLNYTFFGPIFPFGEMFDRMDAQDVDFWGITSHEAVTPHPHHGVGSMAGHIQSHWIAVRRDMFLSDEYREYWADMPMITSYFDSIDRHEGRFTSYFASLGFVYELAFPSEDYPSQHPIFDNISLMLDDRLPILKRRIFFHDPDYLDRQAIIGRDVTDRLERAGFPMDLIWSNVVRSAKPRVLHTNFSLLEILPDLEERDATGRELLERTQLGRTAVVAHLYYDELIDEIVDHAARVPGEVDLYVTTTDETKRAAIREAVARRGWGDRSDVRLVESNRGRDISAFFVGCADVLRDERYEFIVKIHGKKSVQDGWNAGQWFKRHLLENLLPSEGYAANLFALFQKHGTLGMVFPPVIHMGYPTLGHAWFLNKGPAGKLLRQLGVSTPLDDSTPVSPYGSMFIARREALRPIVDAGFTWDDFPGESGYQDGTLAHVLERIVSYAAHGEGFHTRTVMNTRMAAISHTFLEYKLQELASFVPYGHAIEQVPYLSDVLGGGPGVAPSPLGALKRYVAEQNPASARALRPAYAVARKVYAQVRSAGGGRPS
ncbi:hypothetical protein C5E07_12315 [Pseudoclavibacter sp. RFBJ3]|nr:hypothetical protein C5C12_11390 [Pseudoclavibacter sp. RFBJ5]PPF91383.1 hypothetical protein C5E07_12315 [Pseudoclavibacter sp. RFBJ3]PPF96308.1 hypothetical protein C5C19_15005 [Pseudoclavibacter sp. RFBH5]PPG22054.1 hypothetical protein C5E13_11640 [Pseudoclavibacter sp. RFBI4]